MILKEDTRIWIAHDGDDENAPGITRDKAFKTPQAAIDFVACEVNLNNHQVQFFLVGSSTPYPGMIFTYFYRGAPHDYAVRLEGECEGGVALARIEDSSAGCVHVAGNCQVYVRNLRMKASGPAPCVIAPYGGFMFLENFVVEGAEGQPLIVAGPVGGRIDVGSPWWIEGGGSAAICAWDGGSVFVRPEATCYVNNNPLYTGAFAAVSYMGRIESRAAIIGTARGPRWARQSCGLILTGRNADEYFPGDTPGSSYDGTGWCL